MKNLLSLLTVTFISLPLYCQISSGTWYEIYNRNNLKVEISFDVSNNGCYNGSSTIYSYRFNGYLSSTTNYINWKLDYLGCDGNKYTHANGVLVGGYEIKNELGSGKLEDQIKEEFNDQIVNKKILSSLYSKNIGSTRVSFDRVTSQPESVKEQIFDVVEENPEFIGGMAKLYEYLGKNIKYPEIAKENGIQGKVFVQFVVWKDGTIRNVKVIKGLNSQGQEVQNPLALEKTKEDLKKIIFEIKRLENYKKNLFSIRFNKKRKTQKRITQLKSQQAIKERSLSYLESNLKNENFKLLENEAIRVIKAMPKWTPGKQRGKAVNVRFTIPIKFRIS